MYTQKTHYQEGDHLFSEVLGQNGLLQKLNIKNGLLPKLLFKIAPINPHKHKNHFLYYFCILSQLTIPFSVLCVIFFFKTLAPSMGHCERDIVRAAKHQG